MQFTKEYFQSPAFKKIVLISFITLGLFLWFSVWLYDQFFITTDDAYVDAPMVPIAARIPGKINQLFVQNNQYVEQGALLFNIDPEPFLIEIAAAKAQVAISEAQLAEANLKAQRTFALVKTRYASAQAGDTTVAALKTATGNLALAKVKLQQAQLNLEYSEVHAPISGYVTNSTLQTGTLVTAHQPLFSLVDNKHPWINANFKETQIENIRQGQYVTIVADMYPDHPFTGVVDSISGGTGAAFSLLPPQNATGNWVKVTQRIPVKIIVTSVDPKYPLRVGASSEIKIYLKRISKNI